MLGCSPEQKMCYYHNMIESLYLFVKSLWASLVCIFVNLMVLLENDEGFNYMLICIGLGVIVNFSNNQKVTD
uniref:Copper transporter n=1 Tax=Ciona intestinalis TaxID=7719 RepID=H2XYM1_CIOIN